VTIRAALAQPVAPTIASVFGRAFHMKHRSIAERRPIAVRGRGFVWIMVVVLRSRRAWMEGRVR
jgi:hypothetical protein